jgi:two-component system, chemotaxis family, response regulator Rcp1
MEKQRKFTILSVEDNQADIFILRKLFSRCKSSVDVNFVCDGEQAMNYLFKKEKYTEAPTPDLILLDLNLPKKDGKEVLKEIKNSSGLRHIPVVVLTTSAYKKDIQTCLDLQASSYFFKPQEIVQYQSLVDNLIKRWFVPTLGEI